MLPVILLTGATGVVGSAVLRRLTASGETVRCLVRDPKRLSDQRVRVQIALGDLANPSSFRNALRGVHTVIHLAASIRDQPRASIEELNGVATMRLVRGAQRAGARRFVFFSALGASEHSRTRFFRSKALAQAAVETSDLDATVFMPSIVYTPGDPWLTLLQRLSWLPAVPVSGSGRALYQPIWAEDAASAVMASLNSAEGGRFELAGPQQLSYDGIVRETLHAWGRRRRLLRDRNQRERSRQNQSPHCDPRSSVIDPRSSHFALRSIPASSLRCRSGPESRLRRWAQPRSSRCTGG